MRDDEWPLSRPNMIPWPPVLYAGFALAAYALEQTSLLPRLLCITPVSVLGWFVAACGIAISASGALTFFRRGAVINPAGGAVRLVTAGIYTRTRNPMYLGVVLTFAGLSFALCSLWLLILTPALWLALQKLAVEREERHLSARFGQEWEDYAKRVRRWL